MTKDWILQTKETRRTFATATWVPLRGYYNNESGDVKNIGYISEWFGCNAVAFFPEYKDIAAGAGRGLGHPRCARSPSPRDRYCGGQRLWHPPDQ